jgi:hypothetical protein
VDVTPIMSQGRARLQPAIGFTISQMALMPFRACALSKRTE